MNALPRPLAVLLSSVALAACAGGPRGEEATFTPQQFQDWSEAAPDYRVYPGDVVEVTVHTAPELSGRTTVAPDGRAILPLAGSVMISDTTAREAAGRVADAYAQVLRDPIVEVRPVEFASQRVLVGGEVGEPGVYDLPGARIGALEAVMLAGGFETTARRSEVVVLRRSADGGVMARTVDLRAALSGRGGDAVPLRRHDIVFVPRSGIAEVNLFVEQYVRNILPIDAAFSYALADAAFNND